MIDTSAKVVPFALILVPTRELAMQVSEAIFRYGRELNVEGHAHLTAASRSTASCRHSIVVHIVVATPGRRLDHIGRGSLQSRTRSER